LNSRNTARKAAAVAWNCFRQKGLAFQSRFRSAILFSISARRYALHLPLDQWREQALDIAHAELPEEIAAGTDCGLCRRQGIAPAPARRAERDPRATS
jgi:hypothetical protein